MWYCGNEGKEGKEGNEGNEVIVININKVR